MRIYQPLCFLISPTATTSGVNDLQTYAPRNPILAGTHYTSQIDYLREVSAIRLNAISRKTSPPPLILDEEVGSCNMQAILIFCMIGVTGDVFVSDPPEITLKPRNQQVKAGGIASFYCAARGDPTPVIQWKKNSKRVSGMYSTLFRSL